MAKGPGYAKHPGYRVEVVPCPKRVRVRVGDEFVADSMAVRSVLESRHTPVYYFPRADVRTDLMQPTDHASYCPFKGTASYWNIGARENAVWSYEDPYE